jgi:hypothetical protein
MSNNNQIREKFIIHPEKLRQLDKTECYLKLPIFNPVKFRVPLKSYIEKNKSNECENPPRISGMIEQQNS